MIPTSTCDFSNVRTIASSAVLRPDFDAQHEQRSAGEIGAELLEVVATDTHHREHGRFVAREVAEGGLQGEARRQDVDAEGSPTPGYRSVPPSGARPISRTAAACPCPVSSPGSNWVPAIPRLGIRGRRRCCRKLRVESQRRVVAVVVHPQDQAILGQRHDAVRSKRAIARDDAVDSDARTLTEERHHGRLWSPTVQLAERGPSLPAIEQEDDVRHPILRVARRAAAR